MEPSTTHKARRRVHRGWITPVFAVFMAAPASGQQVRARVIDQDTRQPINAAAVSLITASGDTAGRAATGRDGFFTIKARADGEYAILVRQIGYADHRQGITISGESTLPAILLTTSAVPLKPVEVSATSRTDSATAVGMTRASHILAGKQLALLEQHGIKSLAAIRELGGLRTRELKLFTTEMAERIPSYTCIESVRRVMTTRAAPPCSPVALIIDGVAVGDPFMGLRSISLAEIESLEYFTPVEAGNRFGLSASANGAIVVWTRGRGPHKTEERRVK